MLEALKNKAMLLGLLDDKEKAAKTATVYLEMAIPMSKLMRDEREIAVKRQMDEIEKMGPQHARAVDVGEMMRKEGERQVKAGEKPAPAKPTTVRLTGAALAAHLNKQEALKTVQLPKPVTPIGNQRLPGSRPPKRA